MESGKVKGSELLHRRNTVEEFYSPAVKRIELLNSRCHYPLEPVAKFAHVRGGKRLPANTPYYENEDGTGVPYIRTCDIHPESGSIDLTDVVYVDEQTHQIIANYQLQENDIVISIAGTIGAIGMLRESLERCNFNENMAKVRVFDPDYLPDYVAAYFASGFGQAYIEWLKGGAVQAKLSLERIKEIQVPKLSSSAQSQISEIMQSAYSERQNLIQEAEELGRGISEYVLGRLGASLEIKAHQLRLKMSLSKLKRRDDPEYYSPERFEAIEAIRHLSFQRKPLGKIVTFSERRVAPQDYSDSTFNYLSLANVQSHSGELLGNTLVTRDDVASQSNIFEKGDVLFGRLRPYLNKVYCADEDMSEGLCSTEFYVFRPDKSFDELFLTYYLLSPLVVAQTKHATTGSALPRLLKHDFSEIEVPLVPFDEQIKISAEIKNRRQTVRQKLQRAESVVDEARREVDKLILGEDFIFEAESVN
ncbi:MAG: restriction endonuclease subunit S [Acidobacteria bacterium]|nr:restriction endonuclease subunit S [Acidobacteriota bacterium]